MTISSSLPNSFSKERYSIFLGIFFKSLQGSYITPQTKVTSNQNITLMIDNIKSFTPLLINSTVSNYSLNDFIISNITIPFIFDILIEIENNINAIHILKSNCFFEITIKDIVFNLDDHIIAKLPSIFNINEENVIVKVPNSITMFPLLEFITSKKEFSKVIINEVLYPKMNQILTTEFNLTGNAGASGSGGKGSGANWTHQGGASVYNGYGKGQGCSTSEYASRRYWIAGTGGYAKIVFKK